jgi:hypothetical protein
MKHFSFLFRISCSCGVLAIAMAVLLTLPTLAQQPVAVAGATAAMQNIDTATNIATIEVTNRSAKEISAFVFSYSIAYSDGKTIEGEFTEDWGAQKWAAHKTWEPGGQRTVPISLTKRDPISVTAVNVEVTLVAYSDQTVEVRSNDAFERLVTERKSQAQALQDSTDAITKALNSPGEHPTATALQTLTSLRDSHSRQSNVGYLNETVKRLQAVPKGTNERTYLTQELASLQAKATLYRDYAQLRRLP